MKKTTLLLVHTTLVCNQNVARRARPWAALGLLAALAFAPHPARAAVTEAWDQRFNYASAVAVDGRGSVVVTGYSYNGTNFDFHTAKYAAVDGALLWEQRYNGPANSNDYAIALAVDSSGNVVVTGPSWNGSYNDYRASDYYTAKYAATNAALLWEQRYNGPANGGDIAIALAVDASGNVVVTGYSYNGTNDDYYTVKYASAGGALLWQKRYNGPANSEDRAQAVAVDGSGNVVVTGYSFNGSYNDYRASGYYTAKYAATNGALLWEQRYNGPANGGDIAIALAVDASGNVVVTGYSYNGTNDDYYTVKYASAGGALLWQKRYNGPANSEDRAQAVAVDGSGNVVVTGYSYNGNNNDYYTAKYAAANGALLWEQRYNGPENYDDYAQAVAVDSSGNVGVTGYSMSRYVRGEINYLVHDYYTAKYGAADGALLWEKRYNAHSTSGLGLGHNGMLALGSNNMAAVAGSSGGDCATVVYWENLPPVSIARIPAGIRLRFTGVPGRSYTIERAPAVTGPWSTLATPTAPPGGLIEYVDTNAPAASVFYRTSAP